MHCSLRGKGSFKNKDVTLFFLKNSHLYKTFLHFSTGSKKQVPIEKFMNILLLFRCNVQFSLLFRKQDVFQAKLAFL